MTPSFFLFFLVFVIGSYAFPTLQHLSLLSDGQLDAITQEQLAAIAGTAATLKEKRATFSAAAQHVDVSGMFAFVPPGPGDVRGPCPGLNALSNHGYLPHNGVGTVKQYTAAVKTVYNMGIDLGSLLSVFGSAFAGNIISLNPGFSMGGITSNSQNLLGNLGGLLGQPVGLSGTHGQYEQDSSATRGDLYVTGDNSNLQMSQFLDLYNLQLFAADPNYSMDVILEHNINRYYQSLNTNPYFWYGPVGGFVIRNAGYAFLGRLFANYSEDYPVDGRLSKDTLKSFFAISGAEGAFVYTKGNERIPEAFYHRATPYGLIETSLDLTSWAARYPVLLSIGGNTGTTNSFTGISLPNLTSGLLNAPTVLDSNNALCLALALVIQFSPSLLHSLYATITTPLQAITNQIGIAQTTLNCPQIGTAVGGGTNLLESWKALYPGVKKAGWGI